jgi:hypothetical protein
MLQKAESLHIANALLEILSILSLGMGDAAEDAFIAASQEALRTVYVLESARLVPSMPFCLRRILIRAEARATSPSIRVLNQIATTSMKNMIQRSFDTGDMLCSYTPMLVRHWCWLTQSDEIFAKHGVHILDLVDEIVEFAQRLTSEIGGQSSEEKKDGNASDFQLFSSRRQVTSLPFLNAATIDGFYRLVMKMVVGALALLGPAVGNMSASGPYTNLEVLLHAFARLVDVYEANFPVFPRPVASAIVQQSHLLFVVVSAQLRRCVEWRCMQPILLPREKTSGVVDAGSLSFLRRFFSVAISCTFEKILNLCNFWEQEEGGPLLSQLGVLRRAAEKTLAGLRKVAFSNNIPISSESKCEPIDCERFLGSRSSHGTGEKAMTCHDSDSESSFGVAGAWGASDGNSDDDLYLQEDKDHQS